MIPNPWVILAAVLAFLGFGAASYAYGDHHGVLTQKVADKGAIDKVNKDLTDQKTQAAAILKKSNDDLQVARDERDAMTKKLENEHVANQAATTALRDKYAGLGLRFVAKAPGCGSSSTNTVPQADEPAGNTSTAVIQLPDSLAGELRQSAAACDSLKDDYKLLYDWAHAQ